MSRETRPGHPARGTSGKHSVELIALAAVGVLLAGLAATTAIVFSKLADELAKNVEVAITNRVISVDSSIANVLSLAADEAMNLMSTYEPGGPVETAAIRERLGRIQSGLIGCTGAWIVPRGQPPIVALGTPRESPELRDWWREYLDLAGSVRNGTFGNLGIRRNLGFVAPPFRGVTGIGTLLPVVVSYYVGMQPAMTAFFEIDMTVILDDLMNRLNRDTGGSEYPIELYFYDRNGILVETTRNLPLVRLKPFQPATAAESDGRMGRGLSDYLAPGGKTIEASYRDDRFDLLCVGKVPAAAVMKNVRRIAMNVATVGIAAIVAVVILGLMLMQAFRRARSFEKAQLVARFEALQAKINPHFLFNTLDSMIGVVEARDYATVMRMLKALSSMLHMTVRRTSDFVTLAEELEYVRSYIAIQEVRYRDRFTWSIESDPAASNARICRFGIQPIVENCFTHGVYEGREGMRIDIAARLAGDTVVVEVRDDGPGCAAELRESLARSFAQTRNMLGREGGLFNVHDRIRMSFGEPYGLELLDTRAGFGLRLTIPRTEARRDQRARRGRGSGRKEST